MLACFRRYSSEGEVGLTLTDPTLHELRRKHRIGDMLMEKLVAELIEEGHMYTTVDVNHFAALPAPSDGTGSDRERTRLDWQSARVREVQCAA